MQYHVFEGLFDGCLKIHVFLKCYCVLGIIASYHDLYASGRYCQLRMIHHLNIIITFYISNGSFKLCLRKVNDFFFILAI